jgi:uncharacterized membrane protein HdeD (DUF308 family)
MLASMAESRLASQWGWLVFRGVIGVLFGLFAFTQPGAIGLSLVLVFGVFAFVGGIATVITAARAGRVGAPRWGWLLLEGLLWMAIGAFAVLRPPTMAALFVGLIAAWALVSGALEIASAIRLRKVIEREWALGLAGALSIVFGLLVLWRPVAGAVAMVWWLGAYSFLFGILMIVLGFRLRRFGRAHGGGQVPVEEFHQPA